MDIRKLALAVSASVLLSLSSLASAQQGGGGGTTGGGVGGGNTTSTALTSNVIPKSSGPNSIVNSSVTDDGTTVSIADTGGLAITSTNAGIVSLGQGSAQGTSTSAVGLTAGTSISVAYNMVVPPSPLSGYLKFSSTVNQTGCTASGTFLCGLFEPSIDLTADVGATVLGPVNGGWGLATLAAHQLYVGNGTGAPVAVSGNNNGSVLAGTGAGFDPSWSTQPTLGGPTAATGAISGKVNLAGATSGIVTIQPQAVAGTWNFNFPITAGNAGEFLTSQAGGSTAQTWTRLFATNAQTTTYQALAADFASCKTITVPSGTFTITLVASGSQPPDGQCIDIINYGSGVVTVARSGQNINGAAANQTLAAGSASAPTGTHIVSNGTDYSAQPMAAGAGGTPSFPLTVAGTVTSGGIPYFNSTTQESSSAVLATNGVVLGGGAGGAPTVTTADSTTTHALFATAGAPAFRAVAAGDLPTTLTSGTAITNAALTTPTLGTPASGTLTNVTGLPVSGLVSATGAIPTLADGNNPLVLNCALTSGTTCLTTGETTAATTASAVEHQITTLTTSTAIPLKVTQGAAGPANAAAPDLINISAAAAGGAASASNAGSNGAAITLLTGAGSAGGATTGIGGAGGTFTVTQGVGGAAGGTATNNGGNGGGVTWTTGAGGNGGSGAATAGSGGSVTFTLGAPGTNSATGTAGTVGLFNVTGTAPASTANTTGVAAGTLFQVSGVTGGADSNAAGTAGKGSSPAINSGTGGAGTGTNAVGGAGGDITVTAGNGGASAGTGINSNGGNLIVTPGTAGTGGSGTAGKAGVFQVAGANAGFVGFQQGAANTLSNVQIPANTIIIQAPTSVTSYTRTLAAAAPAANNSFTLTSTAGAETYQAALPAGANPAAGIYNFNTAKQTQLVVSGTEYYITNSNLNMPAAYTTAIAAGTTMRWHIQMQKTAAGTGSFQVLIKKGTNGSTADTSIVTITAGATQTGVADNLTLDITLTWTSATAAAWSISPRQTAASATGFGLVYPAVALDFSGTISAQTTTTANDKYGISVISTTGTPTITVTQVQAEAYGVS